MTTLLDTFDEEPEFCTEDADELASMLTLYRIHTPVRELDPAIWGNDQ
jgi:hypothetical protein